MQSKHLTTFKTKECMTTDSYMEMSFYRTHTPKHITDTHIHTHTFVWDIIWFSLELCRWERPNLNSDILTLNLRFTLLQPYVCVWIAHSCLILCNPVDCSLQGSFVHGILQARILERVAISSSRRLSRPRDQAQVSCIAGRFFTIWVTWEAHYSHISQVNLLWKKKNDFNSVDDLS